MRYLVTGITGQLGYDVVRVLKENGVKDIYAPTSSEFDITNKEIVVSKTKEFNPDVIIHCAAYTKVDQAEIDTYTCYKVNVDGTKNMVEAAKDVDAKIIYISTDYVFDGEKKGAYLVDDKTNPKSIYGKTKLEGEEIVSSYLKYFIVRISWVFGINGNNFVKTMLNLSKTHKELTVVADQIGSPTYTYDLAKLLYDMSKTTNYGTYHATNEGSYSWADFARLILKDKDTKVIDVTTLEYQKMINKKQAPRPKNSLLDKEKLVANGFCKLPPVNDALERYLIELEKKEA